MTNPQNKTEATKTLDPRVLEILVCPVTKTNLRYDAQNQELISDAAKLAYPIQEGIPVMLVDEARPLNDQGGERPTTADKEGDETDPSSTTS